MQNPTSMIGFCYGVIPLGVANDSHFEFLVFGGYDGSGYLDRTCVFRTNLSKFEESEFSVLTRHQDNNQSEELLCEADDFNNIQFFPVSAALLT